MTNLFHKFASLAAAMVLLCSTKPASAQQVAFTWDDLPAHSSLPPGETRAEIIEAIIHAMQAAGLPKVYGFANGVRLQEEPASAEAMALWEKAGLPIGNHTWSHMNLNEHTAREWEADFERNEELLSKYSGGRDTRWVRFPYLAEGDTDAKRSEIRAFLASHHYRIAAVTMSFEDYSFNEPYARCVAKKDEQSIAELEAAYLAAADRDITYRRGLAKATFGHDIPYVLLMHVGAMDARMLPRLLNLYKERGFSFITLEQAETDPFYANDLNLSLPGVPDTLEGAAQAKHVSYAPPPAQRLDLNQICK